MSLADDLSTSAFDDLHPSARLIYAVLRSDGPMTRAEIATTTGVSKGHVSTSIHDLRERGLVEEQLAPRGTSAHRQCYALSPDC